MPIIKKGTRGSDILEGTDDHDYLYGYGFMDVLIGGGGNDHLDGGASGDTMIGGLGDDHYYVDNAVDNVVENAGEGTDTVHSKMSNYTLHANVEILKLEKFGAANGTGNELDNIIYGNAFSNIINGGGGDDTIYGEYGADGFGLLADTLIGGTGDDRYYVNTAGDAVIEAADEGNDTVHLTGSINYTLGDNVENLVMTYAGGAVIGTGNGLDNSIIGNSNINTLIGGGGDDILDGRGGPDTMIGGLGDDEYKVNHAGDVVTELAGQGIDKVWTTVDYTLAAHVENLHLAYSAGGINGTGNGLDNDLWGNGGDNVLIGGGGDDTFHGGDGADTMIGGIGDDKYWVQDASDVIIENADEGVDRINAWFSYTLGDHVEELYLIDDPDAINATGNGLDNEIWGNLGANTLDGGAGADIMHGGGGSDHYWVDNVGDQALETSLPGIDWVWSSVDFSLGGYVENLTLLDGAGEIDGFGSVSDNEIYGNDSANLLDGKSGADTVLGAGGNDTLRYWYAGGVDHLDGGADNDTVDFSMHGAAVYVDLGSAGTEARTTGTWDATGGGPLTDIANLDNVENIVGTLYGDDTLIGDDGDNRIEGLFGNDVLTGNGGQDAFVFRAPLSDGTNVDQITDFSVADDIFHLDNAESAFSVLADGALTASQFHVGDWWTADADDRIFYNSETGGLFYDADGGGLNNFAHVQFAQVSAGLALTHEHFLVV
jgi:Ca2+-binding RTX toxin-like protein